MLLVVEVPQHFLGSLAQEKNQVFILLIITRSNARRICELGAEWPPELMQRSAPPLHWCGYKSVAEVRRVHGLKAAPGQSSFADQKQRCSPEALQQRAAAKWWLLMEDHRTNEYPTLEGMHQGCHAPILQPDTAVMQGARSPSPADRAKSAVMKNQYFPQSPP